MTIRQLPLLKPGSRRKPALARVDRSGDVESIPEDILNEAPLKLSKTKVVPYPVIRDWESEMSFAISRQISSLGPDLGVMMEFQSPYKLGRTILLMTGAGSPEVSALTEALLEPGVQDKITGDLAFIDLKGPGNTVKALSAGDTYYTGESGILFLIEYYLYKYPFLNYILLSLALLLQPARFVVLLRIRKKRMHEHNDS
jgi:hypothetical protein